MKNVDDFEGVVVLGFPRSGTTLIRRLLNAHPALACPPESYLLSAASRFLEEADFAGGLSLGVLPGLAYSGFDRETVLARLREFLFGFWRDICANAEKRYWVEKTAIDIFHIPAIKSICGDRCRYVCIVRHPLDVICSLVDLTNKMQSFLPEIHTYVQRYRSPIHAYAHSWVDSNIGLCSFIDEQSTSCILLRYEDLVSDPVEQIRRVCDFLGQPTDYGKLIERAMRDRGAAGLGDWKTYEQAAVTTASVNRHNELDKWTISELAPILDPLMTRFGYEELRTHHPLVADGEERTKDLARMVARMKLSET